MTALDPIDRQMGASVHRGAAYGTIVYLGGMLLLSLLRFLPGAPDRPFSRYHLAQATLLHLAFTLVSVATCGLGFVVLAVPVHLASLRAAEAAAKGEWHVVPVVGRLWRRPEGVADCSQRIGDAD